MGKTMMEGVSVGKATSTRETDRALLVRVESIGPEEIWIPKSQIHDDSEVYKANQSGDLVVGTWFAEQKGWA